jgi:hypothetical protein
VLKQVGPAQFNVTLRPPLFTSKSRLLLRFLSSRHVLQISLKDLNIYDQAKVKATQSFLACPLELLGRRFVLFHIKDNKTAWFIETVHTLDQPFSLHHSDKFRFCLEEVVNWCNSLKKSKNMDQVQL